MAASRLDVNLNMEKRHEFWRHRFVPRGLKFFLTAAAANSTVSPEPRERERRSIKDLRPRTVMSYAVYRRKCYVPKPQPSYV